MRQGAIDEIVDIGCAGALDPSLGRGDLVLSSDDLPFDATIPIDVRRRSGLGSLLQGVAARRGVRLKAAPILTHERFISERNARIGLFERTGCAAVQMEHAWFLQRLQALLPAESFEELRVTHLVLITDAVPPNNSRRAAARSTVDALAGYLLPGCRGGIASLRREVLGSWP
jgi:purine-nucleoside phosphorylase